MDKTVQAGSGQALRFVLIFGALAAAAVYWMARSGTTSEQEGRLAEIASMCPRWVSLAEELVPVEGGLPGRCEYVSGPTSAFGAQEHVYKAGPNVEVRVTLAEDRTSVPASAVIRDTKSQASVTYNAEALALVK